MPLSLTWQIALVLIADGLLLAIGWRIGNAVCDVIASLLSRRAPPSA
jgi:hypothetical protein